MRFKVSDSLLFWGHASWRAAIVSLWVYAASQQQHNRCWRLCALLASGLHRRSQATLEDPPMDDAHFDSLTRAFSNSPSRRQVSRALGGVALGALALLGVGDAEAGKKGKKKKKDKDKSGQTTECPQCPQCTQCPTPISCVGQPDDAPCDGGGKCYRGGCVGRPICTGFDVACQPGNTGSDVCCSGYCASGGSINGRCSRGNAGRACYATSDCQPDYICVGYRCQQTYVN